MGIYNNCLRPAFTAHINKLLAEGFSINLIGSAGTGRTRLLEDIKECSSDCSLTLIVNMKNYKMSFNGFMSDLWAQAGLKGKKAANLSDFIKKATGSYGKRFNLFLDNFDAVLQNYQNDTGYNGKFYDELNFLKNNAKVSLMCVTSSPYIHSLFIINNRFETSRVELRQVEMPKLSHKEIQDELIRRTSKNNLLLTIEERALIENTVHLHKKPYSTLTYFMDKLSNAAEIGMPFQSRIKIWGKQTSRKSFNFIPIKKAGDKLILFTRLLGLHNIKFLFSFFAKFGKLIDGIINYVDKKVDSKS